MATADWRLPLVHTHAAIFQRWRADKRPIDCGYDQLEVTAPYELEKVFGARG